nr:tetratricopeptide repeat protein [Candidatus Freyarchaeota archaeon]
MPEKLRPNRDDTEKLKDYKKLIEKGVKFHKRGKAKEAIKCYDEAIKINPNDDEVWWLKGNSITEFDKDEAIKCYDEAIKINPKHDKAWANKGIIIGALSYDRLEEAIRCFDEAIKINPKHDVAWFFKGMGLLALKKPDEATKCFDEAVKLNPKHRRPFR